MPPTGRSVKQLQILIVGGGIAGLATARALHQRGFRPQVVERATEWPEAGTGIYIPANGLRALKNLGLDEAVVSRGHVITRQRFLNRQGSLLLDIDLWISGEHAAPAWPSIAETSIASWLKAPLSCRFVSEPLSNRFSNRTDASEPPSATERVGTSTSLSGRMEFTQRFAVLHSAASSRDTLARSAGVFCSMASQR